MTIDDLIRDLQKRASSSPQSPAVVADVLTLAEIVRDNLGIDTALDRAIVARDEALQELDHVVEERDAARAELAKVKRQAVVDLEAASDAITSSMVARDAAIAHLEKFVAEQDRTEIVLDVVRAAAVTDAVESIARYLTGSVGEYLTLNTIAEIRDGKWRQ